MLNIPKDIPSPRNSDKYSNIPKPYLNIAEGMESQFINHMLTELDKTVVKEIPESQAEQYYKSLLNNERADLMAKSQNGVGLKDIVLNQIYPKYMRKPLSNNEAIGQYQNIKMENNSHKGEKHE